MNTRRRLAVLRIAENGRLATLPDATEAQRAVRREARDFILKIDDILSHKEDEKDD